jgi:hypothetical protein
MASTSDSRGNAPSSVRRSERGRLFAAAARACVLPSTVNRDLTPRALGACLAEGSTHGEARAAAKPDLSLRARGSRLSFRRTEPAHRTAYPQTLAMPSGTRLESVAASRSTVRPRCRFDAPRSGGRSAAHPASYPLDVQRSIRARQKSKSPEAACWGWRWLAQSGTRYRLVSPVAALARILGARGCVGTACRSPPIDPRRETTRRVPCLSNV